MIPHSSGLILGRAIKAGITTNGDVRARSSLTTLSSALTASPLRTFARAPSETAGSSLPSLPSQKSQAVSRASSSRMRRLTKASMLSRSTRLVSLTLSLSTTSCPFRKGGMAHTPPPSPRWVLTRLSGLHSSRRPLPSTTATTATLLAEIQEEPQEL